jgi:integrase
MQLDLEVLREFREGWKDGRRSRLKKLERLRAWLKFCVESKWAEENHARKKLPKIAYRPTLLFSREEMLKILAAFDAYGNSAGLANTQRLRAFALLLRYSGMRIGDCVKCGVDRIDGNHLFLYRQKTGTPVRCVLPDFVLCELEQAPKSSDGYFFWTGNRSCTVRSESGNGGLVGCSSWRVSREGTQIGFATHFPSPSCRLACH